jgi:hypothetical protein
LKHEILWKTLPIPFDRLDENLGLNAVKDGDVLVATYLPVSRSE